jgi:hypothetical protein
MSDSEDNKENRDHNGKKWPKVTVSGLEADIAYFDARLSMLEENAATTHQEAQTKAFKAMESTLIGMLLKMRLQSGGDPKANKKRKKPTSD